MTLSWRFVSAEDDASWEDLPERSRPRGVPPEQQRESPTDHRLARLQHGDPTAFRELYDTQYPMLWDYAMRYVRVGQTAEDIVHDVFHDLWERRTALPSHALEPSYLLTAVRHRALQLLRHEGVVARVHADDSGMGAPALLGISSTETELELTVLRRIETLAPRARHLFLLRWRYQMSYPEIARALGISVEAAKKLGQRVASTLTELLEELR